MRCSHVVTAAAPEGVDEPVLDTVGGELTFTGGAHGNSPEAVAVAAEQLAEGVGVPLDVQGDEGAIGCVLEPGHVSP